MKGILFIPGHNARGTGSRYRAAKMLGWLFGFKVRVLHIQRPMYMGGVRVTTPTEEFKQAIVAARGFNDKVTSLIVAGHSQGGSIAAKVVASGIGDGYVSIMGDYDSKFDINYHLKRIGVSLPELKNAPVCLRKSSGCFFWYTHEFFEDYKKWDIPEIVKSIKKPKLFIAGLQDTVLLPKHIKKIAKYSNGAYAEVDAPHRFGFGAMLKILKIIKNWSTSTPL